MSMKTYRITFQAVFEIEAGSEDEAFEKLNPSIDWGDGDIIEVEELEG